MSGKDTNRGERLQVFHAFNESKRRWKSLIRVLFIRFYGFILGFIKGRMRGHKFWTSPPGKVDKNLVN